MRLMFEAAKKHLGDKPVQGVEVGTNAGTNALEVLDEWEAITKLYCIDYYPTYCDFFSPEQQFGFLNCAVSNFTKQLKAYLVIEPSVIAADRFEPESMDFIYIDANHAYKFVKEDILAWLPKIKKGGVIGGHDLDWEDLEHNKEYSVHKAVIEIFGDKAQCDKSLFTPNARTRENGYYTGLDSDWWVLL